MIPILQTGKSQHKESKLCMVTLPVKVEAGFETVV
jgi:hypothetical protein